MDQKIQDRMCSIHKGQKCIVVNIDPKCNKDQRHCCAACLADQSQLRIIKDYEQAKVYLEQNIKTYKNKKENQNRMNLEVLNTISKQLNQLQKIHNQTFDDIQKSINDQIKYIMEESISLDDRLKLIDIDKFFSNEQQSIKEFDNEKFRNDIQAKIEHIIKCDAIIECRNQLQMLDIKVVQLSPPEIKDEQVLEAQKDLKFSFPCPIHKQPIHFLLLNEGIQKERRLACDICFANNNAGKAIKIQNAKISWNSIKDNAVKQIKQHCDKFKTKLSALEAELKEHEKQQVNLINAANHDLQQKQKYIHNLQIQIESFNKEWIQLNFEEALQIIEILSHPNPLRILQVETEHEYENQNDDLNTILENSLKKLKMDQQAFFDSFTQVISMERSRLSIISHPSPSANTQNEVQKLEEKRTSDPRLSVVQKNQTINYQVVQQSKRVQNEVCNAMAINKQLTVLVAGCGKQISVYEFIEGKLRQTQQLNDHTGDITSLYFMKNTNQFISGSADNSIRVWGFNNFNQYGCDHILKNAHSKPVNSIIATKNEDILITCSSIIKFWNKKKSEWDAGQKIKGSMDGVYSISLNEPQNTLLSAGYNGSMLSFQSGSICIIKPDHQGLWQIVQTIKTRDQGYKISFLRENIFAFSKIKGGKLHLYEYNEQQKQYVKSIFLKIDAEDDASMTLPQTFNQEKQLIVNQHGKSINLIKVKDRLEFEISQTIKFETNKISGVMSDNGQYLITWDNNTNEFIVRTNKDEF